MIKKLTSNYFLTESDQAPAGRTLDLERNPTVLLVWAANRFNRNASRYYQDTFGISAMDWRMLVMLCKQPGIAVSAASPASGYDKGAVSRSLQSLESAGLAVARVEGSNSRNKLWHLTRRGQSLHDKVLEAALERQKRLLAGMTADEVLTLNALLQKFMTNLEDLESELE